MTVNDNDARIGYGRRTASSSSSRESSPAARQKRAFTPNSDDGESVVPPPAQDNTDATSRDDTPVPLIRQALGFAWQPSTANVITYEAVPPSNTNAIRFLPGQAPPKKKRKRAKPAYSAQTSRFRLVAEPTQTPTPEPTMNSALPSAQPPIYAGAGPYSSMYRFTSATSPSATMSNPSAVDAASPPAQAHSPAISSTIGSTPSSSYSVTRGAYDNITAGSSRSRGSGPVGAPAATTKNKRGRKSAAGSSAQTLIQNSLLQRPPSTVHQQEVQTSHYRRDYEGSAGSHELSAAPPAPAAPLRPLRMLTILIEDVRSGVPDHQLAEIQVHLRPAEDLDGGFWANAKEVCEKWQAGPSRVDGPARVYTLRGKYRQFFMRVDADNVLEAVPCNLGVTKERTLEVVVEAPPPKGKLPLPPRVPRASGSGSDSDIPQPSFQRHSPREIMVSNVTPGFSFDPSSQSRSDHRPKKRRRHSEIHTTIRHNSSRSSPQSTSSLSSCHTPHRTRQTERVDRESSSSSEDEERELSPPVLGRLADTVAERDDAIAKFVQSDIESDKGWPRCMSIISHGGPKRISDMLWCYNFVESKVKEHENRRTPPHWDGAPNCWVERRHIWQVLNLPPEWGEEGQTVVKLINYYGKTGRRYQDPCIVQAIDSTDPPTEKTWKRFVTSLRVVDERYVQSTGGS